LIVTLVVVVVVVRCWLLLLRTFCFTLLLLIADCGFTVVCLVYGCWFTWTDTRCCCCCTFVAFTVTYGYTHGCWLYVTVLTFTLLLPDVVTFVIWLLLLFTLYGCCY